MALGSTSKTRRVRRCKHAFYYSDMLKLQRAAKSIAPARGSKIHECLQTHYNGGDWTKPIQDLKIEWDTLFDEERAEWGELPNELYRILRGYIRAYRDVDAKLTTLATEFHFEFPIGKHTFQGYIDWIYADADDVVWVADHKTVKTIPKEQDLYMDEQTLLYAEACKRDPKLKALIGDRKLGGVVFNHIRTKAPREPQVLKSGGISKAACDTDVATYFTAVKNAGLNIDDYKDMLDKLRGNVFFKRIKMPVSPKTTSIILAELEATLDEIDYYTDMYDKYGEDCKSRFTRNVIKQRCNWDCEYAQICMSELAGMNVEHIIDDAYVSKEAREEGIEEDVE